MENTISCNGCTACCLKMLHRNITAVEAASMTGGNHVFTRNRQHLESAFQGGGNKSIVYKNTFTDPTLNNPTTKVDLYITDCQHRIPGIGCDDHDNIPISCRNLEKGSRACHCAINDNS